jgi:hypothetical protein
MPVVRLVGASAGSAGLALETVQAMALAEELACSLVVGDATRPKDSSSSTCSESSPLQLLCSFVATQALARFSTLSVSWFPATKQYRLCEAVLHRLRQHHFAQSRHQYQHPMPPNSSSASA